MDELMTDEQRYPATAALRAQMDAVGVALHEWAMAYWDRVIVPFAEAYGRAAEAWMEQNRPLFDALNRAASGSAGASAAHESGKALPPKRGKGR